MYRSLPILVLVFAAVSLPAYAADPTLTLEASAEREVLQDQGRLALFIERQADRAPDAARDVNAALDKVRKLAKQQPELTVKSGYYSTYPVYAKDKISAYRVRGELIVESGNLDALSAFSGAAQPDMQVAGLDFSVSPALGRKVRAELMQEAADAFAAKAQAAAKAFGFAGYSYKELQLQDEGNVMPIRPMAMVRAGMASMSADSGVPVEAGKERIAVRVQGTIELKK